MVDSLVALGALLQPGAVAIVAHERREAKVDAALTEAMARAGLTAEPMALPEQLLTADRAPAAAPADAKKTKSKRSDKGESPLTLALQTRLQLWRVRLQ